MFPWAARVFPARSLNSLPIGCWLLVTWVQKTMGVCSNLESDVGLWWCWAAHGAGARRAAWWARAMPPGVRPVGGVLGVRPDGGWSTAAPRGSAGRVV